jgi:hypothetical protein
MTIGPTFGDEVAAAGLSGLPFSWNANGVQGIENLTTQQQAALNAVISAHNPLAQRKSVIAFDAFIARFTGAEYLLMQQKRTSAGAGALCQQWDISMVRGTVDMNSLAAQNFKAAMVTAAVLTQARADTIFNGG